MSPYFPILILILLALVIGIAMSALAHYLGPKKHNAVKKQASECRVS